MKTLSIITVGALLMAAPALAQPVIDGTADLAYGAQIGFQDTATGFGDSDLGLVDLANGSELDAGYGIVVDCTLYLVLAGNLESNFNKLEIFFDTRDGGQNQLAGNNPDVDGNALNRMGDDGSGNGIVFDADFSADFYITVTGGNDPYELHASYAELYVDEENAGIGYYLGMGGAVTDGTLAGGTNPNGVLCTINNINIAGVLGDGGAGGIDLGGFGITTGVEIAIPLGAIGAPVGDIKICTFINGGGHDWASNQCLGTIGGFAGALNPGEPRLLDFTTYVGDQFFAVANSDPCGACCIEEECFIMTAADCADLEGLYLGDGVSCFGNPCSNIETGACCTLGDCEIIPEVTCLAQGGDYLGDNTVCTEFTCNTGACCTGDTCDILRFDQCAEIAGLYLGDDVPCDPNPCGSGACCISTFCVIASEADCIIASGTFLGNGTDCTGNPCGAPAEQPVIDGTADVGYGLALSVQDTQTQFGDNNNPDPAFADGSELDQAFATIVGDRLYLVLAGNLESNFNKLEIFFDTRAGGQQQLRGDNPDVDFNGLNRMGDDPETPEIVEGLWFDDGFEADFYLLATGGNDPYELFVSYAELYVDEGNPGTGGFIGLGGAVTDGLLTGGDNPDYVFATIDNSNILGVIGGTDLDDGSGILTGFEVSIPLSTIGSPAGDFKICTFVNGQQHDWISNQILGPIGGGENPAEPRVTDFRTVAGDQFFIVPNAGPGLCAGDLDCDGSVTFDDIDRFVEALGFPGGVGWPHDCPWLNGDCNDDGDVTFDDIDPFVALIGTTCE